MESLAGIRIAFAAPWVAASDTEMHSPNYAALYIPEALLMAGLSARGATTRCFRPSADFCAEIEDHHGNFWSLRPLDVASAERGRNVASEALVASIRDFDPHVVIIKGTGTKLERALYRAPCFIIIKQGGKAKASLLLADLVLTESSIQDTYLKRRRVLSLRMPKQVDGAFFDHSGTERNFKYDIVNVGRLVRGKNHELLQPLVDRGYQIALVGDGERETVLRERWRQRENVTFLGKQSADEVAGTMRSSRVLVHVGHTEGLPRVVVEAMATGLPVVAIRGAVDADLVTSDCGRLVEPSGLVAAVGEVCELGTWERRSRASIVRYEELHGGERFRSALDEIAQWLGATVCISSHSGVSFRRHRLRFRIGSRAGIVGDFLWNAFVRTKVHLYIQAFRVRSKVNRLGCALRTNS